MKAFIAGALVAHLPLANAGVFYETSSRDLPAADAKPVLTRVYAQDGRLRQEEGEGWDSVAIITAQTLITIKTSARSYHLMDQKALTRVGAQERANHEKNVAQRGRLPTNVRDMLDRVDEDTQRALAMEKQPLDYRATNRHEILAGFSCSIWEYYWKGNKEAEYCIAPPASIPGGAEWMAALASGSPWQLMAQLAEFNLVFLQSGSGGVICILHAADFIDIPLR